MPGSSREMETLKYPKVRGQFTLQPELPGVSALALSNFEHLGATYWAHALGCRPPILHGYRLSILHFLLSTAFHTICLHLVTSFHLY